MSTYRSRHNHRSRGEDGSLDEDIDEEYIDEEARYLLWSMRVKITKPRMAIVTLLLKEKKPLSISQISEKIPDYSQTSLYRTLEILTAHDIAQKINAEKTHARYEIAFGRKHHHHLICTGCGDIEDVSHCLPQSIEQAILMDSKHFASLSRHSLEFFGICKRCAGSINK